MESKNNDKGDCASYEGIKKILNSSASNKNKLLQQNENKDQLKNEEDFLNFINFSNNRFTKIDKTLEIIKDTLKKKLKLEDCNLSESNMSANNINYEKQLLEKKAKNISILEEMIWKKEESIINDSYDKEKYVDSYMSNSSKISKYEINYKINKSEDSIKITKNYNKSLDKANSSNPNNFSTKYDKLIPTLKNSTYMNNKKNKTKKKIFLSIKFKKLYRKKNKISYYSSPNYVNHKKLKNIKNYSISIDYDLKQNEDNH